MAAVRQIWSGALMVTAAVALPAAAQVQPDSLPRIMTLQEALQRGRNNAVEARLARLAAQGTVLREREQRAALLPQVDGSGSVQRQTINLREFGLAIQDFPAVTDPFTLYRARLGASQVLFDPALMERLRAARDTAIAAGLDADQAAELGAATAGAAWLRLAGAEETVLAREEDSVTAFALLDIAQSQVEAGTAARIERTRSETEAASVRIQIAVARNERDRARLDLALAVNLPPGTPLDVRDTALTADAMPGDINAAIALANAHRLDLAAERERQQVLQHDRTAVKREWLPSLMASGFLQTSGTDSDPLRGTWNIGVGLDWALFDGFRRQRRVDEQDLRIQAGQRRLHDLENRIDAQVRRAALDVASASEQMKLASDRVRLAEEELTEARERFSAGVAGSVETTNAQAAVSAARDGMIQARLANGAAQVNALRAMGLLDQVK